MRVLGRALLLSLLLVSCRSFDVEREQVFLRYRPDSDVIDVVLVYDGVGAKNDEEKEVAEATTALQGMARGKRHFMIWDWPFDFDLDELIEDWRHGDSDRHAADFKRSMVEYESNISVTESRFLRDPTGRLCLLQRLRFARGSRFLSIVDLVLNAWVLDETSDDDPDFSGDERSDELFLERARRGGSWARFDGTDLEISIPMTPELAARELGKIVATAVSSGLDAEGTRLAFEPLSALSITGEELRLRFAPTEDGWIAFTLLDNGKRGYRRAVATRLGANLALPEGDLAAETMRLKDLP